VLDLKDRAAWVAQGAPLLLAGVDRSENGVKPQDVQPIFAQIGFRLEKLLDKLLEELAVTIHGLRFLQQKVGGT
jgi:hypothetical protein